jgi:hypothetical protein
MLYHGVMARLGTWLLPAWAAGAILAAPAFPAEQEGKGGLPEVVEDARLDEVRPELEGLFAEVDEEGLPLEIFTAKVREGLVKKVAPQKIASALEKLLITAKQASGLLEESGREPAPGLVRFMTELLGMGVGKQDAVRFLEGFAKADPKTLEKGLIVALMMVEKGAGGPEAVDGVLGIYGKDGSKGLDAWMKSASSKGGKSGKKKPDSKKDKPGKGKPAPHGDAKGPGKSPGPHGK